MSYTVQSSPTLSIRYSPSPPPVPVLDLSNGTMDQDPVETVPIAPEAQQAPDPTFFDLQPPDLNPNNVKIEDITKRLFSEEHLQFILGDHVWLSRFSAFLNKYRIDLVPTLVRYLEMRKALKAIEYANSLAKTIRWPSHTDSVKFSRVQASSVDARFEDYAARELSLLCSEALPLFITNILVSVVSDCITKDVTGQSLPIIHELVGDLAEVYCLTDPSAPDNPIIYASEEFHRTTQYGTSYAIGRNCRFLQGPATDKNTTNRLAKAISLGVESNEILLNYRRDGTPFVNLLMCAPLYDDKGVVRYFIGAQVDITGLVQDGLGIDSFRTLLHKDLPQSQKDTNINGHTNGHSNGNSNQRTTTPPTPKQRRARETLDKLQELSLMFSQDESEIVVRHSRTSSYPSQDRDRADDATETSSIRSFAVPTATKSRAPAKRVVINPDEDVDISGVHLSPTASSGNLPGAYKHYLLVRPYPSLQIIFVSPSLRLPGLLRTNLFTKLGGSSATLSALEAAFRDGASVTAKVQWMPKHGISAEGRGRERFIRCCPLLGSDDRVGVWMVILASPEGEVGMNGGGMGLGNANGYHSLGSLGMYGGRRRGGDGGEVESVTTRSRREREREREIRRVIILDQESGGELDGGFGLKRLERERLGSPSERELYAEYLRGSMSSPSGRKSKRDSRRESRGIGNID